MKMLRFSPALKAEPGKLFITCPFSTSESWVNTHFHSNNYFVSAPGYVLRLAENDYSFSEHFIKKNHIDEVIILMNIGSAILSSAFCNTEASLLPAVQVLKDLMSDHFHDFRGLLKHEKQRREFLCKINALRQFRTIYTSQAYFKSKTDIGHIRLSAIIYNPYLQIFNKNNQTPYMQIIQVQPDTLYPSHKELQVK
jgi:hypothetical protein